MVWGFPGVTNVLPTVNFWPTKDRLLKSILPTTTSWSLAGALPSTMAEKGLLRADFCLGIPREGKHQHRIIVVG
jgi:hypothetical protein